MDDVSRKTARVVTGGSFCAQFEKRWVEIAKP